MQKYWMVITTLGIVSAIVVFVLLSTTMSSPCAFSNLFNNAEASSVPMTTKSLYDSSDLVIIGRITHSSAWCEGTGIWTHMHIAVEDSLKNPQKIGHVRAKSIGGTIGSYGYWVEDSLIFDAGDRALLFLYKDKPTDTVYRISSGGVINDTFEKESLRFVDLKIRDETINLISSNSSKEITLFLQPFFSYNATTAVTVESFAYYNSTIIPPIYDINNIDELDKFGLAVTPVRSIINVYPNDTAETKLQINASKNAVPGLYGLEMSAMDINSLGNFLPKESSYAVVLVNVTNAQYDNVVASTELEKESTVIARFEPERLSLTKDTATDIKVNFTYIYQADSDAPRKLVIANILLENDFVELSEEDNARPDETIRKIFQQRRYGPPVLQAISMSNLILMHDVTVPIELKAGETKTASVKITARSDYPDGLLNKKIIVKPYLIFNWEKIDGLTNPIEVTVLG